MRPITPQHRLRHAPKRLRKDARSPKDRIHVSQLRTGCSVKQKWSQASCDLELLCIGLCFRLYGEQE